MMEKQEKRFSTLFHLMDSTSRWLVTLQQTVDTQHSTTKMKKKEPRKAMKHLAAVAVLGYCTVAFQTIPGTLAFLSTNTRNNGRCNYVGNTKQFFGERGALGDEEPISPEKHPSMNINDLSETKRRSRIRSIRCENFAGMTNGQDGDDANVIKLSFDEAEEGDPAAILGGNLVCVTGETGSGKSLLVSKIADLLTGGKASPTLLQGVRSNSTTDEQDSDASTEMVLSLFEEEHLTFVSKTLTRMGLDPSVFLENVFYEDGSQSTTLWLKRVISMTPQQRMKSACYINGHAVSLKVLKAIASPLIAIVNAPAAASALGRPALRLSMIDSGIPSSVVAWVHHLQTAYRKAKQYRVSLEKELANQVLPASISRGRGGEVDTKANEEQLEMLRHWIEELDGFERRISELKDSLCSGSGAQVGEEELEFLLTDLDALDWNSDDADGSLYETLLDLHDKLKSLDARIIASTEARDALASLSESDSARAALERTRQLLIDAAGDNNSKTNGSANCRVDIAAEKAHDMLNLVEDALLECANFMDDEEKGLEAALQTSRRSCSIPTEELLEYISEWNVLARKHGVTPYQLPSCHNSLKKELTGGIEAGKLLPEAKLAEKKALGELEEACKVLTEARSKLCQRVSDSISRRLPRLGMENSKFEARLRTIDNPSYSQSHLGVDEVDFYLLHEDNMATPETISNGSVTEDRQIGGKIESVASSGEKARVLLAIECEIPGSISATSRESAMDEEDQSSRILPVAVIYDEIDAHVGGRASVSVAQMLFDQSKACQVLSITHSPSLAAIADTHICVHRGKSDSNGRMFDVVANRVDGVERRKELARMASGDMVMEEAEVFAEALLRDATSIKTRTA